MRVCACGATTNLKLAPSGLWRCPRCERSPGLAPAQSLLRQHQEDQLKASYGHKAAVREWAWLKALAGLEELGGTK